MVWGELTRWDHSKGRRGADTPSTTYPQGMLPSGGGLYGAGILPTLCMRVGGVMNGDNGPTGGHGNGHTLMIGSGKDLGGRDRG